MSYVLVGLAALLASCLTLFSGFGLGTLLMPVFALFFPLTLAVAATALVHGANNVFKALLLGRQADVRVVLRFGIPAIAAAVLGALVLGWVSNLPTLGTWPVLGRTAVITPIKVAMGFLMVGFAVFELHPRFQALQFREKHLVLGGLLSGFFGGLSGHQGALRSAFLAKCGLDAQAFVSTNAILGLMVDLTRITVYATTLVGGGRAALSLAGEGPLILTGILAAFMGVMMGKRWVKKVTMVTVQKITGSMLLFIAVLLTAGIL